MKLALTQFALRVSLTVTKPQLSAKDDKATNDAEAANKAHGAGQYRKDLYPKHLIAPISQVESSARAFIARNTITSILPTAKFMEFADELSKFEVAFNQSVTVFLNNYASILTAAKSSQGDMFDPSLYPDMSELRSRFSWTVNYYPVADTSAFAKLIAPMESAAAAQLTAAISSQVQAEQENLVADAVARLKDVVAHLAVVTSRPDRTTISKVHGGIEVKPPIFRQSVVDNITEITGLLSAYADALPPDVTALMEKANTLAANSAATLRDDTEAREETRKASTALLLELDTLMGYAPPPAPMMWPAGPNDTPIPVLDELSPPVPVIPSITISAPAVTTTAPMTGDLLAAIAELEGWPTTCRKRRRH